MLVSIVTPSLNQARFIETTIRSVLEQDYPWIEHVVVDGGSTDETLEILRRYDHLRWVSEPDEGQAEAVNKGFRLASGAVFGWLNADDLYLPGAVATAVATILETACGLVYGGWRQIDENGAHLRDVDVVPFVYQDVVERYNAIAQPTAFFTREAFEAVGGLDSGYHYAMDYDLWLKIGARFEVRAVPEKLAAFRFHEQAKTALHADSFWPEVRQISRRHGSRFFSPMYVRTVPVRHPWVWRARMGYRLIAAGRVRELLAGLAGKARLRRRDHEESR